MDSVLGLKGFPLLKSLKSKFSCLVLPTASSGLTILHSSLFQRAFAGGLISPDTSSWPIFVPIDCLSVPFHYFIWILNGAQRRMPSGASLQHHAASQPCFSLQGDTTCLNEAVHNMRLVSCLACQWMQETRISVLCHMLRRGRRLGSLLLHAWVSDKPGSVITQFMQACRRYQVLWVIATRRNTTTHAMAQPFTMARQSSDIRQGTSTIE